MLNKDKRIAEGKALSHLYAETITPKLKITLERGNLNQAMRIVVGQPAEIRHQNLFMDIQTALDKINS